MDLTQIILTLMGFALTVGIAVVGYFVHDQNKKITKLEQRIEDHDKQDDSRFSDLQKILHHHDELATQYRHNFRNEIMTYVGESMRDLKHDLVERFKT